MAVLLSDPDISLEELEAVSDALKSPCLEAGPRVEAFEAAFAEALGRRHGVAVASATLGLLLALKSSGIEPQDEVIAAPFSLRETVHGIALAGARPVFAEVDYWSATLAPEAAASAITARTRAIVAGNTNGHPAAWQALKALADRHRLLLIEDSSEAIGSRYQGRPVGSFGDLAIFDLTQPGPLSVGCGAIVVTDDASFANKLRCLRGRTGVIGDRYLPYRAQISELQAALGQVQLKRLGEILARRKRVEADYLAHIQSFEGIKPPYVAPEVDEVHWMVYLVHLGTRFSRLSRDAILCDLATAGIEARFFCQPLHLHPAYAELDYRKGDFKVSEKLADRAIALPFHGHLREDQVGFIVKALKDASVNVAAGAAIYL